MGYTRTCTSDVSPNEFKLIMHVGKAQKYRLRGVDRVGAAWWDEEAGALTWHAAAQGLQRRRGNKRWSASTRSRAPSCLCRVATATRKTLSRAPEAYLTFIASALVRADAETGC